MEEVIQILEEKILFEHLANLTDPCHQKVQDKLLELTKQHIETPDSTLQGLYQTLGHFQQDLLQWLENYTPR